MPNGAVGLGIGTGRERLGYSAFVANTPLEPEFPGRPDLPDASDSELEPGSEPESELEPESEPETESEPEPESEPRARPADSALPGVLTAVVLLLLAVSAGLITAWVVASLKAVPIPPSAIVTASPEPGATDQPSSTASPLGSEQPRHTPTPSPAMTPEQPPFVHVVQQGEYLTFIAGLYQVRVEDILALNDIKNPDRIRVGRELLIPGYGVRPQATP
jgi:LysM repeat protein